jgi:hypothetical protein
VVPPRWNKTIDDLMAEKRAISGDEIEWARFPRDAEVFEAQADLKLHYLTHWSAPFTGGFSLFVKTAQLNKDFRPV